MEHQLTRSKRTYPIGNLSLDFIPMACRAVQQRALRLKRARRLAAHIHKAIVRHGLKDELQQKEILLPRGSIRKKILRELLVQPWMVEFTGRAFTKALALATARGLRDAIGLEQTDVKAQALRLHKLLRKAKKAWSRMDTAETVPATRLK